jgi:hypothetical protein
MLNMHTKTVATLSTILLLLTLISSVYAINYFTDGQDSSTMETESDFSAWTGTGGTIAVSTDEAHHGLNSVKASTGGYLYKDLGTSYNTLYFRAYVKFSSLPNSGVYSKILVLSGQGGYDPTATVGYYNTGSGYRWTCYVDDVYQASDFYVQEITPDTWYCVEIKGDASGGAGAGELRVYIDDVERITITTASFDTNFGRLYVMNFPTGWNYIYTDCFVCSDSYVGPEGVDDNAPTYSNAADNGVTQVGETATASCLWVDDFSLDTCYFSTNNTGTWVNSSLTVSGISSWANKSFQLNFTQSTAVQYKWYCMDNTSQWNTTATYTIMTTPLTLTFYLNNSTMGTFFVDTVETANTTANTYNYNISVNLQGLPSSESYIWNNFNWTGGLISTNNYNYYTSGNNTVWCYFAEAGTSGTYGTTTIRGVGIFFVAATVIASTVFIVAIHIKQKSD